MQRFYLFFIFFQTAVLSEVLSAQKSVFFLYEINNRGAESHAYICLLPFQLHVIVPLFLCNFLEVFVNMHTVLQIFVVIFFLRMFSQY